MDDLELNELRKRKIQEIQRQFTQKEDEEQLERAELEQQIDALEAAVKIRFTREALQRYGNLKAAHPEKAVQLLVVIGQALQQGYANTINDEQLKDILRKITPEKKEFKINKK